MILSKALNGQRLNPEEGVELFDMELSELGYVANLICEKKNKNRLYFNKNLHIEPTNICVQKCSFCSYRREKGQEDAWELSIDEMLNKIEESCKKQEITEAHIVGGVHPSRGLKFYSDLLIQIKAKFPHIHIKAFTAVEIDAIAEFEKITTQQVINQLVNSGLGSIPGGGAEIFEDNVRNKICPDKTSGEKWLEIHQQIHNKGLSSNATMLYGHIEQYKDRIDHLNRLRELQDKTEGFNTFIPLKYRKMNNLLSWIGEVSIVEDLKMMAISRIYLDNFKHIKSYWPMFGLQTAKLMLNFGADDFDGTIDDSTKIYTMAGVEGKNSLSTNDIIEIAKNVNKVAVERDTLYNIIRVHE